LKVYFYLFLCANQACQFFWGFQIKIRKRKYLATIHLDAVWRKIFDGETYFSPFSYVGQLDIYNSFTVSLLQLGENWSIEIKTILRLGLSSAFKADLKSSVMYLL
jgi:hypothetical protein